MNPGKTLIILGIILVITGVWVLYGPKFPIPLGRLPGDIRIEKENFRFYFPLATCLILSLILTLIFKLFR